MQTKLNQISSLIWGEYCLIPLLAIVGIYLTLGTRAICWRFLPHTISLLRRSPSETARGEISSFQALMTALSATIGTGNIAGVATAIYFGGPGAIFWMWMIALFGMATKYSGAVLAVRFRQTDTRGQYVGGPMYYIRYGLGESWAWLAIAFATFGMIAAFGIGNMVQSHEVASVLQKNYRIEPVVTGIVLAVLAGIVIIGGVRRIADVVARIVPLMALTYVALALIIIISNLQQVPAAFSLILSSAFGGHSASGGFLGATVWMAMRWGFARGIFSNESGLGSAAIAHAAARTSDPARQGFVAMLGTFIDTIVVCTMTALVIILTGAWDSGE